MATYPDGTLLKASGPEVDRMEGGQRRWIPDPSTFNCMGLNWGAIQTIADSEWNQIPKGAPYPSRADNTLLQGSGPKVYVMTGCQRHWIPDPETFTAQGYNWSAIQHVADADLTAIPEGTQIPSVHGTWVPISPLAIAVDAAGFDYDPTQDIIYSKMNPLQRYFGYAYGYDAAALVMNAILDCEPIFFDYAGKTWMIELWKGQYGLETGCEIGVYTRPIGSTSVAYALLDATVGQREHDPVPSHNRFFDCAADSDMLLMSSTLYRNGQKLFSRGPEKHWWLTGFKWGVLSQPEELTMDVSIICLDEVMTAALVNALRGMGYQNVTVSSNTVSFTFSTPYTFQPRTKYPQTVSVVNAANQTIVGQYDAFGFPNNDPNNIPGQDTNLILQSVTIYSANFVSQAVATLAKAAGLDPTQLMDTLTQEFKDAAAQAANFLTQAGYSLASWISSLVGFFGFNLDFSCIIELYNAGPYELMLTNSGITYGSYVIPPPQTIQPGETVRFWLKDPKPSIHGAQGLVQYSWTDSNNNTQAVQFNFDCPTGSYPNSVSMTPGSPFNFYTQSGTTPSSNWGSMNRVQEGGHPLYVAFVWGTVQPPGGKSSWLGAGAYLVVNDYLVSDNNQCFAIMQSDGNFVLYHGSGPSNQGPAYWASNTVLGPGQYFATMQSDGNFVLYHGSDPAHQGAAYWATNTMAGPGQYFAVLQNDANFVLYQGTDPTHQGAFRWNTGVVNGQVTVHNQGGYVARSTVEWDLGGQHQSQSSGDFLLGQTYSVGIPAGATNIHVKCEDATGLVWDPWKTILDKTYPSPSQKTFTLTGTTLNPGFNES